MTADTAKYLPSIAAIGPKSVEITVFWGIGTVSTPYRNLFRLAGGHEETNVKKKIQRS